MKEKLICEKCSEEFENLKEAAAHAKKEKHFNFNMKGTNLGLGIAKHE